LNRINFNTITKKALFNKRKGRVHHNAAPSPE